MRMAAFGLNVPIPYKKKPRGIAGLWGFQECWGLTSGPIGGYPNGQKMAASERPAWGRHSRGHFGASAHGAERSVPHQSCFAGRDFFAPRHTTSVCHGMK
jgi:hypothetical protein